MGVRYSKSIKIGNFLRLNISKNGISATVGKKGASVNIGKKGAYLNLSPSAVGISGTGVSYRTKIAGGKKTSKKTSKKNTNEYIEEEVTTKKTSKKNEVSVDTSVIEEYNKNLEAEINLHKYTDNVMSKEEYDAFVDSLESEAGKEIYQMSIDGDEDTIENMIATFMNNLELAYDARVNYELEDNILYVDLDLPEIESLKNEYPAIVKNTLTFKKKSNSALKEEYSRLVMSLGVFLSANFFNISSYIDEIVMSAFTTARDNNGDLTDQYLYSVKFTRDVFEETDLSQLEDLYEFILQFSNRINMSSSYSFKPIKPYEMESVKNNNSIIEDAVLGLRELGYKVNDINQILPKLSECKFESSSEYLKEGLKLLKELS